MASLSSGYRRVTTVSPVSEKSLKIPNAYAVLGEQGYLTEYDVEIRDKGEVTIPKELRKQYALTSRKHIKLVPKIEGILIKPMPENPLGELEGLARGIWPADQSTVSIIRKIRSRADFETKENL